MYGVKRIEWDESGFVTAMEFHADVSPKDVERALEQMGKKFLRRDQLASEQAVAKLSPPVPKAAENPPGFTHL